MSASIFKQLAYTIQTKTFTPITVWKQLEGLQCQIAYSIVER